MNKPIQYVECMRCGFLQGWYIEEQYKEGGLLDFNARSDGWMIKPATDGNPDHKECLCPHCVKSDDAYDISKALDDLCISVRDRFESIDILEGS